MATLSNSERLKKNRKEREKSASLSLSNSERLMQNRMQNANLGYSINDTNKVINEAYSGWQNSASMDMKKSKIEKTRQSLADYQGTYGSVMSPQEKRELDSYIKAYDDVLADWDNMTNLYGYYKSADAFSNAKKEQEAKRLAEANKKTVFDEKYRSLMDNADFKEKAVHYERGNILERMKADEEGKKKYDNSIKSLDQIMGDYFVKYSEMNDDEKAVADYLMSVDPSGESYIQYAKDITEEVSKRNYAEREEKERKFASETPFGASMASVVGKTVTAPFLAGEAIDQSLQAALGLNDVKYNPYRGVSAENNLWNAQREQIAEDIAKSNNLNIRNTNIPAFLYQTAMSGADSLAGATLYGGLYGPMMGASAYTSTYKDAIERGLDDDHAQKTAIAAGIAEALFEELSIEKFKALKPGEASSVKDVAINFAKQFLTEGSEEVVTDISNAITDDVINGIQSEQRQKVQNYIDRGYTEEEALSEAKKDFLEQITSSFVGGGITGGVRAGASSVTNFTNNQAFGDSIDREKYKTFLNEMGYELPEDFDKWSSAKVGLDYKEKTSKAWDQARESEINATSNAIAKEYNLTSEESDKWARAIYNEDKKVLKSHFGEVLLSDLKNNEGWAKNLDNKEAENTINKIEKAYRSVKTQEQVEAEKVAEGLNTGDQNLVNGEEAEIIFMKKNDDGTYTVKTNKGEVNSDEVTLTKNKATALAYSANIEDEALKEAYVHYYKDEDISDYDHYARFLFEAGKAGADISDETQIVDALGADKVNALYKAGFNEGLKQEAADYDLLEEVANKYAETNRVGTFSAGEYSNGEFKESTEKVYRNLNRTQKRLYRIVEAFAKLSGTDIRVFVDRSAAADNGEFIANENGGVIYINLAARPFTDNLYGMNSYVISTLSHELTHWLKFNNLEAYNILEDAVRKDLEKKGTLEARINEEKKNLEKKGNTENIDEIAMEEVTARACEDMLNDSDTMQEVLSNADQEGLEKLQSALKKWFDHIKEFFHELMGGFHSPNEVANDLQDSYAHLRELWVNGIKEAIANKRIERATLHTSNETRKNIKIGKEGYHEDGNGTVIIDNELFQRKDVRNKADFKALNNLLYYYLRELSGQSSVIASDNRTVYYDKIGANEYTGSESTYHNKNNYRYAKANSAQAIKAIVEKALNPRWSENTKDKHKVEAKRGWTYYDISFGIVDGDKVNYYSGRLDVRMDADNKDYVYDVDIYNQVSKKKEVAPPSTIQDDFELPLEKTISQDNKQSNNKSVKMDSEGKTLTEDQAEFFKDSKARDDEGRLLALFHGSSSKEKFDVFELRDMVNGRVLGDGFYFTPDKAAAQKWGKETLFKVYLNLTNPYIIEGKQIETPKDVMSAYKEQLGKSYDELHGTYVGNKPWWGDAYTKEEWVDKQLSDHGTDSDSIYTFLEDKINVLKSLGYDGIIYKYVKGENDGLGGTQYVAFYPDQIKNTTNKKPTNDPNIRKSVRLGSVETIGAADVDTKTGTAVYSVRYTLAERYKELGYNSYAEAVGKTAEKIAKQMGVSKLKAEDWIKAEESLSSIILKDAENQKYLDYVADDRYSAIKTDTDYPQGTIDLSNLCRKREIFTKMFDNLQKENPDVLFTAKDIAKIRQILTEANYEVACALCYVEDRRQHVGEIAKSFTENYKKALKSKDKVIYRTNTSGEVKPLIVTEDQAQRYGFKKGEPFKATDSYVPNQYDLTTYQGYKDLVEKHPTIAVAFENFNNSRGQSAARLIEGHAEYKREILNWSKKQVEKANNLGGLRVFSFSDFEAIHLIDIVQVVMDCSTKGVMIQAYTKVPSFANLVKNTNIKANRSLIPANKGSKNAYAYIDGKAVKIEDWADDGIGLVDGKEVLAFDIVEGIDITDENFVDMSGNKNIGNVLVGINEKQIRMAMESDFIDYILPFHTNQAKNILEAKGIHKWDNYKLSQLDKKINGKGKGHGVNIYTDVIGKYNVKNKKDFVRAFLNECKNQGYKPRFAEFLNKNSKGEYIYTEGYHKFLVDYKLFDQDGNLLKQEAVKPDFDVELMNKILLADKTRSMNMKFSKEVMDKVKSELSLSVKKSVKLDSAGNELTEQQQEFFKNSKVRDKDGNLLVVYHGTDQDFTIFDVMKFGGKNGKAEGYGIYFTDSTKVSDNYGNNTLAGYLNITNPARHDQKTLKVKDLVKLIKATAEADAKRAVQDEEYDTVEEAIKDTWVSNIEYTYDKPMSQVYTIIAEDLVKSNSNDMKIIQEIMVDMGTYSYKDAYAFYDILKATLGIDGFITTWEYEKTGEKFNIYVAFESNQFKNASNVAPTSNEDIRFSAKMDSEGRELTKGQRNYFKDSKVRDDQGRLLVVYHGSEYSFDVFEPNKFIKEQNGVTRIVGYFSEDKSYAESYGDVKPYYLNIENPLVMDGEAKTLKEWEAFFKKNGITNVVFDSSVTGKNGQKDTLKGGTFDGVTYYAFYEILDMSNYWYGDGNLTERIQEAGYDGIQTNDEYEKAWMPFNAEAVKSVDNENPTNNESILKSTKLSSEAQKLVDELTLENTRLKSENAALMLEKGLEKVKAEKTALINRITEQSQTLSRWLLSNDKNNPVPQSVKEPLGKLLTSISFAKDDYEWRKVNGKLTKSEESLGERMAKVSQLLREIEQDKVVDAEAYDLSQLDWIPEFTAEFTNIKDVISSVERRQGEHFNLNKMTTADLKSLLNMMTALKSAITNMNKCLSAYNKLSVSQVGNEIINYLDEVGQKGIDNRLLQFMEEDNTVPFYFFKRLGSGGEKAFKLLMDGMNQYAFEAKEIEDYAKKVFSGKDVLSWRDKVKTFEIGEVKYSTDGLVSVQKKNIQMTVPQIMSLYCLSKRDQAKNHLNKGGIKIGDFKVKGKTVRQIANTTLNEKDLEMIISSLKPEQKEVADKLQAFMNTTCQKWGNEVTMKRFGFKGMTEKDYFPISVDRNQLSSAARQKGTSLYQLLNMGFTKPINPKAKNPIEIFDIFEVFAIHSTEMAQYHSLALPILDVIRIWNYKDIEMFNESEEKARWHSVKASIENAIGEKGNQYIGLLLADLNGDVSGGRADDLASKIMKNYKTAAVAANLQVATLQPISYISAGYMLDTKYLVEGMKMKSTKDALKYCGIAVWKDMGFYNTSIHSGLEHKIMQDESKKDSIIEKTLYLAGKADEWTWSKLWNACLLETKDLNPNLEDEDLYKKTAERLTEVIYGTQVVDSILTRSQIMRDKTVYSKMITAFQSEPTLAINILMDASESFLMEKRRSGTQIALNKHGDKLKRAATIYLLRAAVESALRAVFGRIRDYDGEEDDETLLEDFLKRFIEELNPLRKIPLVKDVVSILVDSVKVLAGKQYRLYTDTRMDEAIFENLGKAFVRIGKILEKKEVNYKALYEVAKGFDASGLPVSSTFRIFKVTWNNTIGRIWKSLALK